MRIQSLILTGALICGAATLMPVAVAVAESVEMHRFDIKPQELASALLEFSRQADRQVVGATEALREVRTSGVTGELSVGDALGKLLQGTGLQYELVGEHSIRIISDTSRAVNEERPAGTEIARLARAQGESTVYGAVGAGDGVEGKQGNSETAGDAEGVKLEEILVTAQKRTERLQDVPGAVTSLSADKLEEWGFGQLNDITKAVPGLVLIGGSSPGQGQPVLRGIASTGDRNALVGIYLDEVPFTPNSPRFQGTNFFFDPALADVERIEVLKGPQSTLYGASTMGGLIKYVSKRPDTNNFSAQSNVGVTQIDDHGAGASARITANIPLVSGAVAARATAFYGENPGFVENAYYRQENEDSSTQKGFKISLLANLGESVDNTLMVFSQRTRTHGSTNVLFDPVTRTAYLGRLANTTPVDEAYKFDADMAANTTNADFSFATLTNIASYARFRAEDHSDFGRLRSDLCYPVVATCIGRQQRTSERISDELRLASKPGAFEWLIGGFITHEKIRLPVTIREVDANGVETPSNANPLLDVDNYLTTGTFEENAVFGNVTYHFTNQLDATAGIRYSANDQDFTTVAVGRLRNQDIGFAVDDSATNYLATLNYKPNNDLTLYVRAASAYRPGGPNSIVPSLATLDLARSFKSDTLWNYEVGVKGSALDGAVNFSLAAYHMKWTDIQTNIRYTVADPNGGPGTQFSTTGNAGGAKSDGAEVELNLFPVSGLSVLLSGAYNDAKITSSPGTLANVGDPLPYSPKWTGAAMLDYERDVAPGVTAKFGMTYAYVGSRWNQFLRNTTQLARLDAYATLDLRAGISWGQYDFVARVDNVTDRFEFTRISSPGLGYGIGGGPGWTATPLMPRTFSLSLEARF